MKENNGNQTRFARTLALLRAIESYQPDSERLFEDTFSRRFIPGSSRLYLLPGLRHALIALMEMNAPGLVGSLYCRTKYIDNALLNVLSTEIKQVVILGAGFDARAFRISGIEQAHVFELDLPELQLVKQSIINEFMDRLPQHVTFIPVDFDRQALHDVMTDAGFDWALRTFFIWEGVTQYITGEAMNRTFRLLGSAAVGSQVVFTYIRQGIIDGRVRSSVDQKFLIAVNGLGMPWISGLASNCLVEYLNQRGLEMIEDVGAQDFQLRYLRPRGRQLSIFQGERVVLVKVTGHAHSLEIR